MFQRHWESFWSKAFKRALADFSESKYSLLPFQRGLVTKNGKPREPRDEVQEKRWTLDAVLKVQDKVEEVVSSPVAKRFPTRLLERKLLVYIILALSLFTRLV